MTRTWLVPVTSFRSVSDDEPVDHWIPATLPGSMTRGIRIYDWLLDGAAEAASALVQWMRRPSSEVFVGQLSLLLDWMRIARLAGDPRLRAG
jgi:hypothetical protein